MPAWNPMESHFDEREGKPSASGANRWVRCPASFKREQGMPDKMRRSTTRGIRGHAVLEGVEPIESLPAADAVTVRVAMDREAELFDSLDLHGSEQIREKRYWVDEKKLWSAKSDVVYLKGTTALVINYKLGAWDIGPINEDWQMAAEASAVAFNHPVDFILAARIQPLAKLQVQINRLNLPNLKEATDKLSSRAELAMTDKSFAKPGFKQCQWCKAKKTCEEYQAFNL